jgi:hypothetical protein
MTPAQKKAWDARQAMEAAKAACAKVPQPGMPHFGWAKQQEQKGNAEWERSSWEKAENFFKQASMFYTEAARHK